jgi:hypothetical protein
VSRRSQKSFFTVLSTVVRTEAAGVGTRQLAAIIIKNALFAEVRPSAHALPHTLPHTLPYDVTSRHTASRRVALLVYLAGVVPQDEYRHEQKLARWRALDAESRAHVKNEVTSWPLPALLRDALT